MCDKSSGNEWQWVTTNDSEWQRAATSGTMNGNEWQRTTASDNEWQWVVISANFPFFTNKRGTYH